MSVHTGCCCSAWLLHSEGHPAREGVDVPKIASHSCSGHIQAVPGATSGASASVLGCAAAQLAGTSLAWE